MNRIEFINENRKRREFVTFCVIDIDDDFPTDPKSKFRNIKNEDYSVYAFTLVANHSRTVGKMMFLENQFKCNVGRDSGYEITSHEEEAYVETLTEMKLPIVVNQ